MDKVHILNANLLLAHLIGIILGQGITGGQGSVEVSLYFRLTCIPV